MTEYNKIKRYIYSRVKNIHLAEDLTQDTFLEFLKNKKKIKHKNGWLHLTARHNISDFRKSIRNRIKVSNKIVEKVSVINDPLLILIEKEQRDLNKRVINKIPYHEQKLLRLNYIVGLTPREMAKKYKCSKAAIDMRLMRARKVFKKAV